ncbi:MAG: sigma 54-interacting transcriptional regulator [Planctomycetaceae bacterium]|nr:sigma 54-interacting transcriptional regulator [Planctomycetaceae bacterium]
MQQSDRPSPSPESGVAYLVVREGTSWRDVFRLQPGQVTTVGRAPTNRIVLRDEICSRNHFEVFHSGEGWVLRDLGSRNGTLLDNRQVVGDAELTPGQVIMIGKCQLGFTDDISRPFPDADVTLETETGTSAESVFEPPAEADILDRRSQNRYAMVSPADLGSREGVGLELARLYRLGLEMGVATRSEEVAEVVLEGLFDGSCADIGAVLVLPRNCPEPASPSQLSVLAYRALEDVPYQKVSNFLSGAVLGNQEAVLARDISDDSRLASRDSLGEIHARSVICAPIREGEQVRGLIHLYSTNPDNPLDSEDLEFTLAVADQLAMSLASLRERESLQVGLARVRTENQTLRSQLDMDTELVGDSQAMNELRERILKIAPTGATALVRGESGVGKELVARSIHRNSRRKDGPFVCMNCAALSESLLESELFGHEKGAFTGAVSRKPGKFEQAHTGSLFLDEVGEMSLAIQAKFLRVLEGHSFERVGGGSPVQVDVRVIAATNRDLEQAVHAGSFRKDLYFRLQVVEIDVRPLREHRDDIPHLADHFLKRFAARTGRPVRRLTRGALDILTAYDWPGNIRELQNTVERAVILSADEEVGENDIQLSTLGRLDSESSGTSRASGYREISLEVLEQEHILATLERMDWNKSRAAQILGIERSTLDRKLKRYRVTRPRR